MEDEKIGPKSPDVALIHERPVELADLSHIPRSDLKGILQVKIDLRVLPPRKPKFPRVKKALIRLKDLINGSTKIVI